MANTQLNIYYQNARGMRTKVLDLYNSILRSRYDILIFTETWLQDDIFDTELCDNRYQIFRQDRDLVSTGKKTGGGVMVCVSRKFDTRRRQDFQCAGVEMLHVTLSSRSVGTREDLHIILVYMPPDVSSIPLHLNSIGQAITATMAANINHNFILIGDFNLPCLTWNADGYSILNNCSLQTRTAAASFADEISVLGLSQYNLITNTNNRILDLCFSTVHLLVSRSDDPLLHEDSHHPALVIRATELFLTPLEEVHIPRRNYYKGDYEELNKYFNKIDWDDKLLVECVDVAVDSFYTEVKLGVERFIPVINKPKSYKYPVWYSRALIK